jgi:hypothetical protein
MAKAAMIGVGGLAALAGGVFLAKKLRKKPEPMPTQLQQRNPNPYDGYDQMPFDITGAWVILDDGRKIDISNELRRSLGEMWHI